jgi:hypothetical protein
MKTCTKCLETKELVSFYKNKCSTDGLNTWCISCKKTYNQIPEIKKINNTYQAKAVLCDVKKQKKYNYYKEYCTKNRHKINAIIQKYKNSQLQRTPNWLSNNEFWMIEEAYELASLRTKLTGFKWHVDHVLPLQGKFVSGLHTPYNLQVIPGNINQSKGNAFTPT